MAETDMVASEMWVTDLDRTLLDTDKIAALQFEVCMEEGIDRRSLEDAKAETEASGGSFDVFGHLRRQGMTEEDLTGLSQKLVEVGRDTALLYDDTQPFLDSLDNRGIYNLIMTTGSMAWQAAKLAASGLSGRPHTIIDSKHKGDIIAAWQNHEGLYIPIAAGRLVAARTVNLVDDKAAAFRGLPKDCRGYWLRRRTTELRPSQAGGVPSNVRICRTLTELIPLAV